MQNRAIVLRGEEYKITGCDIVDDILKETYGAIVYQEQTMLIMNKLTGGRWTLGKADKMRKVKDLEEYKEDFIGCCVANGFAGDFANNIYSRFDLGYTFNKSHAAAYGVRSMQCAYFSFYHPIEFMTAVLSIDVLGEGKNIPEFIQECKRRRIPILPPDINKSETMFTCTTDAILFPLTGIANVGENAVAHIMEKRPFTSVGDLYERVEKKKVNSRAVTNLIKAGAFDDCTREHYMGNRALMLNDFLTVTKKQPNQMTWCNAMLMQYEMDTLGFNLSVHPLDGYRIQDLSDVQSGEITSCFVVNEMRKQQDRNGNDIAFITVANQYNTFTLLLFNREFVKYYASLTPMMKIAVKGNKDGDTIIVNTIAKL
jgi:DNA polymerase-3 subunit alpha